MQSDQGVSCGRIWGRLDEVGRSQIFCKSERSERSEVARFDCDDECSLHNDWCAGHFWKVSNRTTRWETQFLAKHFTVDWVFVLPSGNPNPDATVDYDRELITVGWVDIILGFAGRVKVLRTHVAHVGLSSSSSSFFSFFLFFFEHICPCSLVVREDVNVSTRNYLNYSNSNSEEIHDTSSRKSEVVLSPSIALGVRCSYEWMVP